MKHVVFCIFFATLNLTLSVRGQVTTNSVLAQEAVSNLVLAIRSQPLSENEFKSKEDAIKQAAKIKNPDSQIIEALFDNYSYFSRDIPLNIMRSPKFRLVPARDALQAIGEPVIPALVERLKTTDDPKLRSSYVALMREIVGKDRAVELLAKTVEILTVQKSHLDRSLELLQ